MAFDPNDPADKKALDDAVKAAVDAEVSGLKAKNAELTSELREARKGKTIDPVELERLQEKLDTITAERDTALKTASASAKDMEKFKKAAEDATGKVQSLASSVQLKDALGAANVAKQFVPAVEAMLKPLTTVREVDGALVAYVGDKTLSDHVKLWAQGDDGKHFIAAGANGGGGSAGDGGAKGGSKTMSRTAFDALDPTAQRNAVIVDKVTITD